MLQCVVMNAQRVPRKPSRGCLWLALCLCIGCATAGNGSGATLNATANVPSGAKLDESTNLRVDVDYDVPDFRPGQDRIVALFKTRGGGTWEPFTLVLTKPSGRATLELAGADVVKQPTLVRPIRVLFVLDRADGPNRTRTLVASPELNFAAERLPRPGEKDFKLLPPNVGTGQLLSDVRNDPRFKPTLPPDLNYAGMRVWGLFKICVDTDGDVASVSVLKSADPLVDAPWMAKMRRWRYRPYTINGEPVPFCHPMRVEVRSQ
jgi:hypothetical protein